MKKITFYDHFTSEAKSKRCILEVVGWVIKRKKKYTILSNYRQDHKYFRGSYFHVLNSAIISIDNIELT